MANGGDASSDFPPEGVHVSRQGREQSSSATDIPDSPSQGAELLPKEIDELRLTSAGTAGKSSASLIQDHITQAGKAGTFSTSINRGPGPRAGKPLTALPPLAEHDIPAIEDLHQRLHSVRLALATEEFTPVAKSHHEKYRDLLSAYLDAPSTSLWEQLVSRDQDVRINEARMRSRDEEVLRLEQDLIELQILRLTAHYGNYLFDFTDTLKSAKKNVMCPDADGKMKWSTMAQKLAYEDADAESEWKGMISQTHGKLPSDAVDQETLVRKKPLHKKVAQACSVLNIDYESGIYGIQEYGRRNLYVRAGFKEMIAQGRFNAFGQRCTADLALLDKIFYPGNPRATFYRLFVTRIRDKWVEQIGEEWSALPHVRQAYIAGIKKYPELKKIAELRKNEQAGKALADAIDRILKKGFNDQDKAEEYTTSQRNIKKLQNQVDEWKQAYDEQDQSLTESREENEILRGTIAEMAREIEELKKQLHSCVAEEQMSRVR